MESPTIIEQADDKVVINHMPITIRSVDRTFMDIAKWWNAIQRAEAVEFPNRTELYDLYKTVELDGHLTGIKEKRIATVVNKKLQFQVNKKKVDAFDDLMKMEKFRDVIKLMMDQKFWGISGIEFLPGATFDFKEIPRKHIRSTNKTITNEQWGAEGFKYESVWNIVVWGKPEDLGLYMKCAPYAIWKKGNMGDWAQYVEVFGQPMIIFTYDVHDEKTRKELDAIMKNLGSGTRVSLPKQVELKLEDGKQNNGNGDLQDKLRNACNAEMSVIVLTVTETTVSGKGSGYAQSKTHANQQDEISKSDMADVLSMLNTPQMLDILKSYGYPTAGGSWVYEEEIDVAQMKADIEIDEKLEKIGVPLGHDYYYDKYHRPKPANYDQLVADKEARRKELLNQSNDNPDNPPPAKGNKKKKKKSGPDDPKAPDQVAELSMWEKFRMHMADFFLPAHKS